MILKLPPLYTDILYIHLIEEKNANEIARIFDMKLNTVKSRISRGLKILQDKAREAKLHD